MSLVETRPLPAPDTRPQLKLAETPRPEAPAPAQKSSKAQGRRRPNLGRFAAGVVLLAVLGGGGWFANEWYTTGRFLVSTDDAYVRTDTSALSAKVAGYVADLPVAENTLVKAGTVILRLDDGDFRLAVSSAKDRIALQNASIARIGEQAKAQQAEIQSAQAKVDMAEADAQNFASVFERQKTLAKKDFASTQAVDQAQLAKNAGITLRPSTLLSFGNPPLGAQFLTSNPYSGLDWPVRLLVLQDEAGAVWAAYTDFAWIAKRHGITDRGEQFAKASSVVESITATIRAR